MNRSNFDSNITLNPRVRLRCEIPGVYESYVDLMSGERTLVTTEVDGEKARLFVNGASQPCLIVSDFKRVRQDAAVALWMEQSADATHGAPESPMVSNSRFLSTLLDSNSRRSHVMGAKHTRECQSGRCRLTIDRQLDRSRRSVSADM